MKTKRMAASEARSLVDGWTWKAALTGWAPGSSLVLTGYDIAMIADVARCFDVTEFHAETIAASAAASAAGKLGSDSLLSWVPIVGWIAKAVVAATVTKALGEATITYMWNASPLHDLFYIKNVQAGLLMDISDCAGANGAQVHQWEAWNGNNQKWTLEYGLRDSVKFVGIVSNRVLDVPGGQAQEGLPFQVWDSWDGMNQNFWLAHTDDGAYIHTRYEGMVVAADPASRRIMLKHQCKDPSERWRFLPA